ncbi:MAG: GNAT family N-acetyltransferase [Candidatus Moranbacteria bacterium]|nr:GNAT family N-acetyltransferase [Candidatus Moranbacteria bacterium]
MDTFFTKKFATQNPEINPVQKKKREDDDFYSFIRKCNEKNKPEKKNTEEELIQQQIESYRKIDYSIYSGKNVEELASALGKKNYLEQKVIMEKIVKNNNFNIGKIEKLFFQSRNYKTRLAIIESLPEAEWDFESKKSAISFLTRLAMDGFEWKEGDEDMDLYFDDQDELGNLYIIRQYCIDPDPGGDENAEVFSSAPIINLAKFGKLAEPMLIRIIEKNWKDLDPDDAEGFFPDESGYEPSTEKKELIDPSYVYTACAFARLKETNSNRTMETILLATILKEAKKSGEKIDFEMMKGLELVEKPVGEDLSAGEKEEILAMARDNYSNEEYGVYKNNPEAARSVIAELEEALDGIKNQRTYTLKYQGKAVAFCRFQPIGGKPGEVYAGSLNVYPDVQKYCVGKYFAQKVLEKESRENVIRAITRADNPANGAYEKMGFVFEDAFEKNGEKYFNMRMDRREE